MEFSEIVSSETLVSESNPVEYTGKLHDGKEFFFRYRWGVAWLGVGETIVEAMKDCREHYWILEDRELESVTLSRDEFEETFKLMYDLR